MIAIIIHHICNQIQKFYPEVYSEYHLAMTGSWGYLGTGIFFFMSGFGIFMSLKNNTPISLEYSYNHIKGLIKPFLAVFLVDSIILVSIEGFSSDIIRDLFMLKLASKDTWFIKIILLCYVVTFITFALKLKDKNSLICIIFTTLFYIIVAVALLGLPEKWYITILNFPLGMALGLYYDHVSTFLKSKSNTIAVCAILGLGYVLFGKVVYFPIINSLCFSLLVIVASQFVNINIKAINYVGKNSIYFYLGHYIICFRLFTYMDSILIISVLSFLVPTIFSVFLGKSSPLKGYLLFGTR